MSFFFHLIIRQDKKKSRNDNYMIRSSYSSYYLFKLHYILTFYFKFRDIIRIEFKIDSIDLILILRFKIFYHSRIILQFHFFEISSWTPKLYSIRNWFMNLHVDNRKKYRYLNFLKIINNFLTRLSSLITRL